MIFFKKNYPYLLILLLFSSCHIFTESKKKLAEYCPGLDVNINGMNWQKTALKKIYVLHYDEDSQKKVETYFGKPDNGYVEGKTGDFANIEIGEDHDLVINGNDHIMVKAIQTSKGTTKVVFDETTQRIVIIEYGYDKK
jgi:hypothetical protein